ncbi:MAG: HAMP domain-containing sensor histidine kinase [Kiritimatiellia bacterium]
MHETTQSMSVDRPPAASPLWTAAGTTLAYIVLCGFYIFYSSRYAAAVAQSPHDLQLIETSKGIAFITLTGLIYFVVSHALFKRIRRQEATIAAQELALLKTERKIMGAMSFAVIAHDLNNLLMTLSSITADLHEQGNGNGPLQAACKEIENGINNLSHLCKRITSSTAHVLPAEQERVDLDDALPRLVDIARKHPDVRFCGITTPDLPPLSLVLNRVLLEEAVLNLVINAAQAAGPTGRIEIRVVCDATTATLAVHDDGPGIPPDRVEAIFDPCYTTKPEGTGIGLVTVKAFASSCEGAISVGKSPLGGALFQIRIPLTPPASSPAPAGAAPITAPR